MNWLPPSNNPNDFDALMTGCLHLTFKRLWGKSIMYIYKATFNTCSNLLIPIFLMYARGKILYTIFCTPLNNCLRCPEANDLSWRNVKDLSSLNFDRQFLMLFIFMFVQGQPEMKSGHFMPAPYAPTKLTKPWVFFTQFNDVIKCPFQLVLTPLILTAVNHISKSFFCQQKGLVYLFNYLYGVFWYTSFDILFLRLFKANQKWKVDKKRTK